MAYVLLWFPLASETFIFREVMRLREKGFPLSVYTLYGERPQGQSAEMLHYSGPLTHIGPKNTPAILSAFFRQLKKRPRFVLGLIREMLLQRMRNVEAYAENTLCFFAGFRLAELIEKDGISLLHSPWANGPATAAWVASRLTGIPFSFTGRAGDIYPEDGLLAEKSRDAVFIRTNNAADVDWLKKFCPAGDEDKIHLVYNNLTLTQHVDSERTCRPPYRILAVGRFCRKKGFPYLITAMARLRRKNFPVHLTLVGDGNWHHRIVSQIRRLGLEQDIDLPGFVPHDHLLGYMKTHNMMVVPSVIHKNGDRDGIPNVIMEALCNGMPVIATDVCGISEVIHQGETGLLIPQRDARAICSAIRWTVSHWEESVRMACAGRELVRKMFDSEHNTAQLYSLYESAMREAARAAADPAGGKTDGNRS